MPVYPVTWGKPERDGVYPHMFKHDTAIWERFLDAYGQNFDRVAYDIALGGVRPQDPLADPATAAAFQYATAKKIDAALENDAECWLCELRPQAGLSAVGSVIGYALLSEQDPWTTKPLVPTIITDAMDGDTKLVCAALDIQVIELPDMELSAAAASVPPITVP